jgi:hypothetical protein
MKSVTNDLCGCMISLFRLHSFVRHVLYHSHSGRVGVGFNFEGIDLLLAAVAMVRSHAASRHVTGSLRTRYCEIYGGSDGLLRRMSVCVS